MKRFYTAAGVSMLLLAAVMLAETFLSPFAPDIRQAASAVMPPRAPAAVSAIYGTPPPAPPISAAHAAAYIPRYEPTGRAEADAIAARFCAEEASETDDSFLFLCPSGVLTVSKHFNQISFHAAFAPIPPLPGVESPDAESAAAAFLTAYGLLAPYDRAMVLVDEANKADEADGGAGTTVCLLPRLGGAACLDFPAIVRLSPGGALLSLEVSAFAYDRLTACRLISYPAAFAALPQDFPAGTTVTLRRASIVYILKDSILQPAYFFEGERSDGTAFRHAVPAAVFAP